MNAISRTTIALLLLVDCIAFTAQAQDTKIEQAIKHRRAAFTTMSTYFSRLLQTVSADRPYDAKQVLEDAQNVAWLSRLPWEGFIAGSEHGDTRAKEDIWLEEEAFKKQAGTLETKATLLVKAAESGDLKKIKLAFEQTRDACNTCHKEFRKK